MENKEKTLPAGNAGRITREYIDSLLVEMRHFDAVLPSTKLSLYGKTFSTPVMTAALSHLDGTYPNGMTEMARGAKMADAVMWCGMGEKEELESIISTGASTIKIIKPYADNADIIDKIHHAESCGAFAVGIDMDHAFSKKGGYDNVHGLSMRPKSLDEIKLFVGETKLPFIIKGVLSAVDAEKCADAGIQGIVVSHHNGRLDYAVPPLMILPEIAKAVNGRFPIFVDCSLESGMDVFKALALGAKACSIGRPLMHSMAGIGAQGVYEKIMEITRQLEYAMAMTASKDIETIDPSILHKKHF